MLVFVVAEDNICMLAWKYFCSSDWHVHMGADHTRKDVKHVVDARHGKVLVEGKFCNSGFSVCYHTYTNSCHRIIVSLYVVCLFPAVIHWCKSFASWISYSGSFVHKSLSTLCKQGLKGYAEH